MLAQRKSQLSRKYPSASLNKCVVTMCLTSCSVWRRLGVFYCHSVCFCWFSAYVGPQSRFKGQEIPPWWKGALSLKPAKCFPYHFLHLRISFIFFVALQFCVSAHGCAGDRGKGQVCQKSTHYKAFPGEAVHASAEITGEACHRVRTSDTAPVQLLFYSSLGKSCNIFMEV